MNLQVNPSQSKARRLKVWLPVYAGLALIILVLVFPSSNQPIQAEIKFLGYTNNTAGTQLVAFEVVNRSSFTIRSMPYHFAAVPPGGNATLLPAYKGRGINLLSPNAHETVLVVPPPTTNAWQVKLSYVKQEAKPVQLIRGIMSLIGLRQKGKVSVVEGPIVEPK